MTIGQLSIVSVVPDRRWRIGSACGSGHVVPVRCKGLKTIAPDGARRARAHHGHREQSVPTECAPGCEARRGKAARQNSASVRRVSSLSGSA